MRAATVIVGAIAAASILIALAFIFSGGAASKAGTKTVVERVEGKQSLAEAVGGDEVQFGGPTKCDKAISVENTTCAIGEQVYRSYEEGRQSGLLARDPESGEYLQFTCAPPNPVICKEAEGQASISFGV